MNVDPDTGSCSLTVHRNTTPSGLDCFVPEYQSVRCRHEYYQSNTYARDDPPPTEVRPLGQIICRGGNQSTYPNEWIEFGRLHKSPLKRFPFGREMRGWPHLAGRQEVFGEPEDVCVFAARMHTKIWIGDGDTIYL
jgi:hypothetical protein